jgi:hypothetical protein
VEVQRYFEPGEHQGAVAAELVTGGYPVDRQSFLKAGATSVLIRRPPFPASTNRLAAIGEWAPSPKTMKAKKKGSAA